MKMRSVALMLAVGLPLSACSGMGTMKQKVEEESSHNLKRMEQVHKPVVSTEKMDTPWLGRKIVERPRFKLPSAFTKLVTIGLDRKVTMSQAAGEITRLTGIAVKISPDVAAPATGMTGGMPGGAMPAVGTSTAAQGTGMQIFDNNVLFQFDSVSLSNVLDEISSRMGISWRYDDSDGAIHFSRYITKTLDLHLLPGAAVQDASVSKSGAASAGGQNGGAGGSFSSSTSSSIKTNLDSWASVEQSLKSMLTTAGKLAVSPATQTVTVTDTAESVSRVEDFVRKIETNMNKQVRLRVEVIQVTTNSSSEMGVNWKAVYNRLAAIAPNFNLNIQSLPQVAAQAGGSLGFGVIAPTGGVAGKWDGSAALLAALQGEGRASMFDSSEVLTLNGQPAPVAVTEQINYISSTTPATGTVGAGGAVAGGTPGLNNQSLTIGYMMNVLPSILNEKEALIQFSGDISTLKRMDTFVSAGVTVQQPNVSGVQFLQRAKVRIGDTVFISGYSKRSGQYDQRGTTSPSDFTLGGGFTGKNDRQELVLLITPEWER